jgi:hypothetical protein
MSIVVRRLEYSGEDKHSEDRYRFSNFLLTLNTNVRFEESDETITRYAEEFAMGVEVVCNNFDKYIMFRRVDHMEDGRVVFADPEPLLDEHGTPVYSKTGKQVMKQPESEDLFYSSETVPKILIDVKPEKGVNSRGQRLHVHIAVRIQHKGYIWVRKDAFFKAVNRTLAARGFPFPVKHFTIRVHQMSAMDYLEVV